jgi:hypothetical protein
LVKFVDHRSSFSTDAPSQTGAVPSFLL